MLPPCKHYAFEGPDRFGDVELIGQVLGSRSGDPSPLQIAATLLTRFGDVAGLARTEPSELAQVPGVGPATAVRLHAALQLGRRALRRDDPDRPIRSPKQAVSYLQDDLRGLAHEELHALYVDRRHHPIAKRILTRGCDSYTIVDPRQVYRTAVQLGARGVLLAHNHPSGDPTPSQMDREVTRRVRQSGEILGIPLLDHLVFAGDRWEQVIEQEWKPTLDSRQRPRSKKNPGPPVTRVGRPGH